MIAAVAISRIEVGHAVQDALLCVPRRRYAALYLRRDRKRVGKKRVTYVSIAHTITEDSPLGKRSKPVVFANLGNEERIDEKMARQLSRSLVRIPTKSNTQSGEIEHSRPVGMRLTQVAYLK